MKVKRSNSVDKDHAWPLVALPMNQPGGNIHIRGRIKGPWLFSLKEERRLAIEYDQEIQGQVLNYQSRYFRG